MSDISEITRLILNERQGPDRGWWQQTRDRYRPGSRVTLSWFDGTSLQLTVVFADAGYSM